jgi:hypothetical protein
LTASDSLNENYTTIVINVKDVNDMPPTFPETLYEKTLNEEKDAPYMMMQVYYEFLLFFMFILFGKWLMGYRNNLDD